MCVGLVTIGQNISGPPCTQRLAGLGMRAATIGTTLGMLTLILDGVATKQLANQWAVAGGAEKAIALANVTTNETINFAVAGLFNMTLAGFPFILLGMAIVKSNNFRHWLGWVAVIAGSGFGCRRALPERLGRPDNRFADPHHYRANGYRVVDGGGRSSALAANCRPARSSAIALRPCHGQTRNGSSECARGGRERTKEQLRLGEFHLHEQGVSFCSAQGQQGSPQA